MSRASTGQRPEWQGPAVFNFGFRPFFLGAAMWVVLAMVLWLASLSGAIALPTRFDPASWHAHEFLFGYLGAVLAGFLLTAVPNWTGRLPLVGWPLAGLFALWVAGRLSVLFSALLPAWTAVAVDLAFPIVLGGLILQEIVAGENWRNLIVLALLAVFTLANALFHFEALQDAYAAQGLGLRLGVATAIMMITVIGGRIIPTFTRNWLARTERAARPAPPMQRFDKLVVLLSLPVLALWVVWPLERLTGLALLVFGLGHVLRLARWQGHHTLSEALVWVLHAAYALIPLGAIVLGLDQLLGQPGTAGAQHVWMAGAIGAMTLAVMTRATLGHTGQALTADGVTQFIYISLFASVLARLLTPLWYEMSYLSGVLWLAAFGGFVMAYGPALVSPDPNETTTP
ncbi:MAG: NnrS family protein [Roseovarius sp.]